MKKLFIKFLCLTCIVSMITSITTNAEILSPKSNKTLLEITNADNVKVKIKSLSTDLSLITGDIVDENSDSNLATLIPDKFINILSTSTENILKKDFNNNKAIVIYGDKVDNSTLKDILKKLDLDTNIEIRASDDKAKDLFENRNAYSITKDSNGSVDITSYYFVDENTDETISTKVDKVLKDINKKHSQKNISTSKQATPYSTDYTFTEIADYGSYGKFDSTTTLSKVTNSANVNGNIVSLWDIKQANTTTGGYSLYQWSFWAVDYLYTRLSVEGYYPYQTVIDHGPTTTQAQNTASISLSNGWGYAAEWSFTTGDITVLDNYNAPLYGRWTNDYRRKSASSRYSALTMPGIRATNNYGNFIAQVSNTITFTEESTTSNYVDRATGVIEYVVPDR